MLGSLWDFIVDCAMTFFFPLVCAYFAFHGSLFFNVAYEGATGLEKIGNHCFAPCHYLFMGRSASLDSEGEWVFDPRFDYQDHFIEKTIACSAAAIPSFIAGSLCKGASLLWKENRDRFVQMEHSLASVKTKSNRAQYEAAHLPLGGEPLPFESEKYQRRPGDENNLATEKEGLKVIGQLLTEATIPWWVDCGTCLGAYRYGGVIPWDQDIDIAALLPDFDNVCHVLNRLDPKQYMVQDWSTREHPKSSLKVLCRQTSKIIDIYFFAIDEKKGEIHFILALENSWFFPEWWKIRERRFVVPAAYGDVFPLRKGVFDGVEVYLPSQPKQYLQRYYGENLAPAKIYDPHTCQYEKDLSHPYWQKEYVH